jgi:putative component of membrane protein insertase Oxa1/YidC/SpoIIIJ protein YidD
MEAVERYGVVRGGAMASWRLLRCQPLAKGGLDAVVKDGGNPSVVGVEREGSRAIEGSAELRSAGRTRASVPTCD